MVILDNKRRFARYSDIEDLLEDRYASLRKWALQLTRGDAGVAEDIVHDLCLYFVVSRPDLGDVTNIDGYLYTCLRHIYFSSISRSAREATQFLSVADFDSIHSVLDAPSADDLVAGQNDLRRICAYALWRKETSKSASYLILHFFHGYARHEIAEIAQLPIAAIYNKLKIARTEVKAHLEESDKLRIVARDIPPVPQLAITPVSSFELFGELRNSIFAAKTTGCLPEEDLLAFYRTKVPQPVPCAVLSHVVSCQRCLALIDNQFQRPTLDERDRGKQVSSVEGLSEEKASFHALMRAVRRERDCIWEHRPRTVSIAVNGRIYATHNIQGEWNSLSTRLQEPEVVRFVEVFTDQRIRLALLLADERPPDGPHVRTQRVIFSDDRYLELTLTFDGLGLASEITYVDPALASFLQPDIDGEEQPALPRGTATPIPPLNESGKATWASIRSAFSRLTPASFRFSPAVWTLATLLLVVGIGSYLGYRDFKPLDATTLLDQSARAEVAQLAGSTEHLTLRVEIGAIGGPPARPATIDLWRDGDGRRYARSVYNAQQQLLASEWRTDNGAVHSWSIPSANDLTESDRLVLQSDLWKENLSPRAFHSLSVHEPRVQKTDDGYDLTADGPFKSRPDIVSAVLVLDSRLHPIRERILIHTGAELVEARFVETNYERRPSSSVPDTTFTRGQGSTGFDSGSNTGSPASRLSWLSTEDVRLTQLEIGVLYQLNQVGADSGDPIEISRTAGGRIQVAGGVADEAKRNQIVAHLDRLADHQLLDVQLIAQSNARTQAARTFEKLPETASIYDVGDNRIPADAMMRRYLTDNGTPSSRMNEAVAQLSNQILADSQRALQDAYALDRLGKVLAQSRSDTISPLAQQEWTEMAVKHSFGLQNALGELSKQLSSMSPEAGRNPVSDPAPVSLNDPSEFARTAHTLLREVQEINHNIGVAFTYSPSEGPGKNIEDFLGDTLRAIPSRDARTLGETVRSLSASAQSMASPR